MNSPSTNITLKITVLGDPFVGKTSLVHKYMGKEFSKRYQKTFGSDISFKQVDVQDTNNNTHRITYSIWDIYGEATSDELTKQFLIGTQAIIFMYDIVNFDSYKNISKWFSTVNQKVEIQNIPIILVCNKIDLQSEKSDYLTTADGTTLYEKLSNQYYLNDQYFKFIETSALEGTNISRVFDLLSQIILNTVLNY